MADLSDVEKALVTLIAGGLFTGGYLPGSYAASNASAPWPPATAANPTPTAQAVVCKLYRGWPESANLDADLAQGRAHVSVFPEGGVTRDATRFPPLTHGALPAATLGWTVSGDAATLTGTISTPQNIALVVNGKAYACAIQTGDTLGTAAARLAALVPGATASGATVTASGAYSLAARVGVVGAATQEVRRQEQGFRVSCWCPTPAARDAVAGLLDNHIAGLTDATGRLTQFFALPDGSQGRITYRTGYTNDFPVKDRVWRRDLCYRVEYPTILTSAAPEVIAWVLTVTANGGAELTFEG